METEKTLACRTKKVDHQIQESKLQLFFLLAIDKIAHYVLMWPIA